MLDHQAPGELRQRDRGRRARRGSLSTDPYTLPDDLPVPEDDGAADHLPGSRLPAVSLPATTGSEVDLSELGDGMSVLFIYPRTGRPGEPLPPGWNMIPGARGCTPQSCAFRDVHDDFEQRGVRVIGLSAQSPDDQREFAQRVHLPFPVLSDESLELAEAMDLPTFETAGMRLYKRLAMAIRDGEVVKAFYPVFPPDENASNVLAWMDSDQAATP